MSRRVVVFRLAGDEEEGERRRRDRDEDDVRGGEQGGSNQLGTCSDVSLRVPDVLIMISSI